MYGGALLILLGILLVFSLILTLYRLQRMVKTGTQTIEYVGGMLVAPVLSLFSLFRNTKRSSKTDNE